MKEKAKDRKGLGRGKKLRSLMSKMRLKEMKWDQNLRKDNQRTRHAKGAVESVRTAWSQRVLIGMAKSWEIPCQWRRPQ